MKLAEFDLRAARGVYNPTISSESFFERSVTPTASSLGGGSNGSVQQTNLTGNLRFGGSSPFAGGSYQFDFTSNRQTTNNQFTSLNPQYPTSLTFTYTQPLLRGLRIDDNRRRIEIAKKNLSLTDSQFRQRTIETIAQVEQAYWDLAFALRNLQVQIDAVLQARTQAASNQRQVEQGVLAPIDIVAANTQVTTFEQNVYTAQEQVTRAENVLKTMLLPDRTSPLWSRPLVPVTPVNLEAPRVPLETAVRTALDNRPELAQLETSAEINQIDARYYKDRTRPQVDLVGTYNPTGLAGSLVAQGPNPLTAGFTDLFTRVNDLSTLSGLPPIPPATISGGSVPSNLVGGYPQSLSNLLAQRYPTVRVGVRISLPLGNETAKANLGRSLVAGSRIKTQRAQAEQIIEADVRNSLQAVRSAQARLAAAASSRSSSELQYTASSAGWTRAHQPFFSFCKDRRNSSRRAGANCKRRPTSTKRLPLCNSRPETPCRRRASPSSSVTARALWRSSTRSRASTRASQTSGARPSCATARPAADKARARTGRRKKPRPSESR